MDMKHIILKLASIAGAALTAVSCLDFSPEKQLSDTQVWDKADNFTLFADEFYEWTSDFRASTSLTYMNRVSDGPHADTRSDLMCEASINNFSAGNNSIPSTDENYKQIYKRLYYVNLLLQKAGEFEPQTDIEEPMGEAYFFRAYLYFELVQMFGDCIYTDAPVDVDNEILYGPRTNRVTVIRNCIADLKAAAELLPETPSADGRLCSYAAWAYLSRIGLYEGTWQKFHGGDAEASSEFLTEAVNAAQKVMAGPYELFYSDALGGGDSYRYMFILENVKCNPAGLTKADNHEYIFYRRHDETLKPIGFNITHAFTEGAIRGTNNLARIYRCQNGLPIDASGNTQWMGESGANTEFENRDHRMNGTMLRNGQIYWTNDSHSRTTWEDDEAGEAAKRSTNSGYQVYKWATERAVQDESEGYDYPIIRYAEVLLNYAEAVYELNGSITDAQLDESLNLVRRRSNPTMTKLSNALVNDHGLDMREEIRAERTVELAFEGFRIDDLKRWKTAETEMPKDLLGIRYTGTWFGQNWNDMPYNTNSDGYIVLYNGREWNDRNYLLPLPSDELQLNPELKQNPGWE